MNEIISRFLTQPVLECRIYGSGHINETYFVKTQDLKKYILQRVNGKIFADMDALMSNIAAVTAHLRRHVNDPRSVMSLIPTLDGATFLNLTSQPGEKSGFWRMFAFVEDSICLDAAETAADFYESGVAFGNFQRLLSDFDASVLTETLPRFHDTLFRYEQLDAAINANLSGRLNLVKREVEFALDKRPYAKTLKNAKLPLRVTHNDTKLSNVLLDKATRKALCVIDLDTVMPGLCVTDFGDAIRFGASTAKEDEPDLSKVTLSLELFEAFATGYISNCTLTTVEKDFLADGAKTITLEQGVRFLTDYINGDIYYHTSYKGQNLDRCRTQFKLLEDMEGKWEKMQRIIRGCYRTYA